MWWKASNDIADAEEFVRFELEQIDNEQWNRWLLRRKDLHKGIDGHVQKSLVIKKIRLHFTPYI